MKKRDLLVVFLMVSVAFIMGIDGCQTTGSNYYYDANGTYVEITDPPGQCVLYKVLGNTTVYKTGLFAMNYAAIKAGFYTGEQAVIELDKLQAEVVRPGATVGSFTNSLFITASKASKVGAPEMVLITQNLDVLKGNMTPLDDCTKYKLLNHIGGQRMLALAFAK